MKTSPARSARYAAEPWLAAALLSAAVGIALVSAGTAAAPMMPPPPDAAAAQAPASIGIVVQVLRSDGTPLAESAVSYLAAAVPLGKNGLPVFTVGGPRTTDAAGRFTTIGQRDPTRLVHVESPEAGYADDKIETIPTPGEDGVVRVTLRPWAAASGRVTDALGAKPVAGARVAALTDAAELQWANGRETRTDADGRWKAANLPPGKWRFRVNHPDYVNKSSDSVDLKSGAETSDVDLAVMPLTHLVARLLKSDGTPAAKTDITVVWEDPQNGAGRRCTVTTDDEGRFEVTTASGGTFHLVVQAEGLGFGQGETPQVATGGRSEPVAITLKPRVALSGTCVDAANDKPIQGASLYIQTVPYGHEHQRLAPSSPVTSDAEGRWQWDEMPAGRWKVRAQHPQYFSAEAEVEIVDGQVTEPLRLAMTPHPVVRGTVVGPDDKPMAGARVSFGGLEAVTDAEGRFQMTVSSAGTQELVARADGYAPQTVQIHIAQGDQPDAVTIRMASRGGTVRGLVFDQDAGKPLAGQEVFLIRVDDKSRMSWMLRDRNFWQRDAEQFRHYAGGILTATTDAEGRYVAEHVAAGTVTAVVCPKDGITVRSADVEVTEGGETAADVAVTLHPVGYVIVRLLKPDGAPLADARMDSHVTFRRPGWSSSFSGNMTTRKDGRCYFPIQQTGTMKLSLVLCDYRSIEHTFELPDDKLTVEADFTLVPEKCDAVLAGRVFLSDGKTPAAAVTVRAYAMNGRVSNSAGTFRRGNDTYYLLNPAATTAADGTFELKGLRPGRYGLYVSPWPNAYGQQEPVPQQLSGSVPGIVEGIFLRESQRINDLEAALGAGGTLEGRILDAKTGTPLANAQISINWDYNRGLLNGRSLFSRRLPLQLRLPARRVAPPMTWIQGPSVRTDAEGRFRAVLPPGQYTLYVWANGYKYLRLDGWKAVKIVAGATVERTLRVEKQ